MPAKDGPKTGGGGAGRRKHILALCGDDPWTVRRELSAACALVAPELHELAVLTLFGEELDGGRLLAEISTPAFGSPVKVVLVHRANRLSDRAALTLAVQRCPPECTLVLLQDDPKLGPPSLVAALARHPGAELRKLYPPDARELRRRLALRLGEEGLEADGETQAFLVRAMEDEPWALEGELEKFVTYLAGQPEGERRLTLEEARELSSSGRHADPYAFAGRLLERRALPALEALLDHVRHGGDLVGLNANLVEEAWKTLQYLEGRAQGVAEDSLLRDVGAWGMRAQQALRRQAAEATPTGLRVVLAAALDLERRLKSESLISEGVAHARVNLPGLLQLQRLVYHYAR